MVACNNQVNFYSWVTNKVGYTVMRWCAVFGREGGGQIENFNWLLLSDKLLHVYVLVVISTWAYLVLGVMAACVVVVIPSLTVIKHLREAEHLGTHGFLSTKKTTKIFINHYKHLKHHIFHFIRYKYWHCIHVLHSTNKLVNLNDSFEDG